MNHHVIRKFCLLLVSALSLMAFTAAGAQAVNLTDGGQTALFLVNGGPALGTFVGEQIGPSTLLVPGRFDILCAAGAIEGSFTNDSDALVTLTFSKCTAWQPIKLGEEHKVKLLCTVVEPIGMGGLALPRKHEGVADYVLFEPKSGFSELGTIKFTGAECPLTKENKITGSFVALVDSNNTVEPLLLFNHAIQELMGDQLKSGNFTASFDSDIKLKMIFAHKGMTFGVC